MENESSVRIRLSMAQKILTFVNTFVLNIFARKIYLFIDTIDVARQYLHSVGLTNQNNNIKKYVYIYKRKKNYDNR